MNKFDSFLRFFALSDDNVDLPSNLDLPAGTYPTLPAVVGDQWRWLVQIADTAGVPIEKLSLGIRPKGENSTGTVCGQIRRQAGATYTEIRLRVGSTPTPGTYQQFALMLGSQTVMGTFRGQFADIDEYIDAIVKHYSEYPYAYTEVDRMGRDIRIRAYASDAFRLSGEELRIGIGNITQANVNSPSLLANKKAGVSFAAEDQYTLMVGADIQAGNVFALDGISYTALGTEKPADILSALSVAATGLVSRAAAAVVIAYAQPGTQTVANTNRPILQLLYNSTSGGNDLYTAVISPDIQIGNIFQIAASGSTTKTVTVLATDTRASLEAQFNSVSTHFVLPAGSVPIITVLVGSQVISNTNNPSVLLTNKVSLPLRTLDVYTIYVGPSVVEGNQYSLSISGQLTQATAEAGDDPMSIALDLGYTTNPFTVNVATGTEVVSIARRGPLYHEPANVAPITLLSARTETRLPYVAEATIPTLAEGYYQFVLRKYTGPISTSVLVYIGGVGHYELVTLPHYEAVCVSNYVQIKASKHHTALVRFGADRPAQVFGLSYSEDGLAQQLRLPVYVEKSGSIRQTETLYQTLDYKTIRGHSQASFVHSLTTDLQQNAFHRNLYAALKHPLLYIDQKPYRCEGEYAQTEPQGKRRRRQATAELVEESLLDYSPTLSTAFGSLPANYAQIERVAGLDGLWLSVRHLTFVQQIGAGTVVPAADYELLLRAGADALRLTIGQDGQRVYTFLVAPNMVNRYSIRLAPGLIQLEATRVNQAVTASNPIVLVPVADEFTVSGAVPELVQRQPGDFTIDYTNDFLR